MIRQVEAAARIILKVPSANFRKSTSGDWVLRMKSFDESCFSHTPPPYPNLKEKHKTPPGALDEDYVGMEADAFEMLKLYHQDNHFYYFYKSLSLT